MSEQQLTQGHESVAQELESLHHLLENTLIADPCTEQNLRLASKEIELLIATGKTPDKALSESLDTLLIAYAEEHPALAQAVKQVIHALGNIGI